MTTKRLLNNVFLAAACTFAMGVAQASIPGLKIHRHKVYTVENETARTLKNVEEQAYDLHDHAVTMQAATRVTTLDRDFFLSELEGVKEDVNTMGKEIARLQALSDYENSTEQQAVERAQPQLKTVAATTAEAMRFLQDRPKQIEFPAFQKLVTALNEQTETLWKGLHDSVTLSDIAKREAQLRKDLKTASTK